MLLEEVYSKVGVKKTHFTNAINVIVMAVCQ
jgi:hypothetical protein